MHKDAASVRQVLRADGRGSLVKDAIRYRRETAGRSVARADGYISPEAWGDLLSNYRQNVTPSTCFRAASAK